MVPILEFLRMGPAVRVDRSARRVIGVLGERRTRPEFGDRDRQSGMTRMRLIQHRTEIVELSGIPPKITVVADRIGDSDDGVARYGAAGRRIRV